jgi:large subunit ribosomal protein L1
MTLLSLDMAIHRRLFRRWADPHVADKVRLLRATLSSSVGNRDGKPGMAKSDADGLPLLEAIERIKVDAQARQRPECRVSLNLLCRLIKSTANGFRGFLQLPHPMGREEERLLVFCPPDQVADLRALGAHHVGGADLIEPIVDGKLQFTRCLGHPDLLPVLTKLARVLGPLGLMPNVKHGTLTPNLRDAVLRAFSTTPYVVAKQTGVLNLCVGRVSHHPPFIHYPIIIQPLPYSRPPESRVGRLCIGAH